MVVWNLNSGGANLNVHADCLKSVLKKTLGIGHILIKIMAENMKILIDNIINLNVVVN